MKISEMITKLEELKHFHGDLTCLSFTPSDPSDLELSDPYFEHQAYFWTGSEWKTENAIIL